ncbi:MAG: alpha/beta hydrolase [Pseudomonadota bacterium]
MSAIEKSYAGVAEGQLHLRRRIGDASAQALVLMHASPSSSRSLEPLMEALDTTLDLFAFDTPCNGQSCAPSVDAPSMADFADMIARGSEALGLERPVLYGTHTGAHIAMEWALARPSEVRALVLDGVALFDAATRAEFLQRYAPPQKPDETGAQFHWAWSFIRDQMLFFPHYKKDAEHLRAGGTLDPAVLHELVLEVLNNLETYHLPYEAVFRHEAREALSRIRVPTLVLGDAQSALDPATAEIADLVPGSEVAPDCASPEAKAAAIHDFLKGLAP